jgi:hypothetical protein
METQNSTSNMESNYIIVKKKVETDNGDMEENISLWEEIEKENSFEKGNQVNAIGAE